LPANVQSRFDAIREARWSELFREEARQWLSAHGLLERVPAFVPGVTDETKFTHELEKLCGPKAEGAFQSKYGFHVLSPDWSMNSENEQTMLCLLNATTFAGFKVGFVGNAVSEPVK